MKVLLVGNYPFDGSTSMKIWANAICRDLRGAGVEVKLIVPKPVLGRLKPSSTGLGKWLGYIDRFLVFPRYLQAEATNADIVHICDHGGAMYVARVKQKPVVVTCHDMLAVRGALGEIPEMKASLFGRILQAWICGGLRRATFVVCVSQATCDDAARLLAPGANLRVVRIALNYPFQPLPAAETDKRLASITGIEKPFLLHVGSNLNRKNRDGVLRIFAQVARQSDMQLVFAGKALNVELTRLAEDLGVNSRVVQVANPDVTVIEALYNRACALLFPSRYEGFGWPPIEAQACACPVVASNIQPIAEVLGRSAILHPVGDEAGMAASLVKLACEGEYRDHIKNLGLENVRSRFQVARMVSEYVSLYREAACGA